MENSSASLRTDSLARTRARGSTPAPPATNCSALNIICVVATSLVYGIAMVSRFSLGSMTDILENDLNTTASGVGLLSSFANIPYVLLQIPSGFLLERLSPEFAAILSCLFMAIGSLIFALSNSVTVACFGRLVSGVGNGPAFLATIAIFSQRFDPNKLSSSIGIIQFYGCFSVVAGNTLIAYIVEKNDNLWRHVFVAITILCVIVGIIISIVICFEYHSSRQQSSLDLPRMLRRKTSNFSGRDILEETNDTMVDDRDTSEVLKDGLKVVLGTPQSWVLGMYGFGINSVVIAFGGLWLIPYYRLKFGFSRQTASFVSTLNFGASAVGAVILGHLSTKFQRRKPFIIIGCVLLTLFELCIQLPAKWLPIYAVIGIGSIATMGNGSWPCVLSTARELNSYFGAAEVATGFTNSMGNLPGFILQYIVGELIDNHWKSNESKRELNSDGTRVYTMSDYEFGFISLHFVIALGIITSLLIRETYCKHINYSIDDTQKKSIDIKQCKPVTSTPSPPSNEYKQSNVELIPISDNN